MQRSGHCAHMRFAQKIAKILVFSKWGGVTLYAIILTTKN